MGNRSIIIVDPEKVLRVRLRSSLDAAGWDQTYCDNAAAAVTHLLARGGDALLVALATSNMAELASVYRAREINSGDSLTILITCSAADTAPLKNYLKSIRINQWITNPCSPEVLLELLPAATSDANYDLESLNAMQARLVKLDYFERLGVERDANVTAIRRAYNRRMQEFDIDRIDGDENEIRLLHRSITRTLNEALSTLRSAERRKAYLANLTKQVAPKKSAHSDAASPPPPSTSDNEVVNPNETRIQSTPTLEDVEPRQESRPQSHSLFPPTSPQTPLEKPKAVLREPPATLPADTATADHDSMDLLSELRAKNQTTEGQAEGTFDSILENIVGRHDAASSSRHQRKMRPGQLGDLFDAAVGAVADERSAQTISDDPLAQSALKQVSSQQDAADSNNANTEHLQAQPEQPETPLATSAHNNEPVALTNQIDSTNEPNTVLTPESTSPQSNNNVTEEPSATEAPATSEKEHLAAADLSDSDSNIASSEEQPSDDDADVLNFDELGAIFDMDESDAAVIVDAALAGHSISQNTDTDTSEEEEPKENEASTPLSAAQLAAIALERQAEKSTPESVDSDVVDEEDLPDLERFAPKIALAPDSRVYDYSARMNAAMGNFDKAKKLLQKANAETPSRRLEYRLELVKAQELLANEKPDEARISLETLVSTHPESDEAATLLTTLKSKNKGILSLFSREES